MEYWTYKISTAESLDELNDIVESMADDTRSTDSDYCSLYGIALNAARNF